MTYTNQLQSSLKIQLYLFRGFDLLPMKLLEQEADFLLEDDWWWRGKVTVSSLLILHVSKKIQVLTMLFL